ncbi:IclR family transcriptional regulator [Bacterioplanes sanyensis]|uniref:IclR family transcriptional regulator n=1 Tax=Bacterioplanes sanyensis TaxID=1249553 RepID=A0A222FLL9_9GAMM|nr:uracil-DNA glycosylase family protein [Bacterioplanes sanyensis]ASP39562.1 IclR family transcriptional regulator [Bacterioplanes sanyensis]
MSDQPLNTLLTQIRQCRQCANQLPHSPRPVIVATPSARLLIVGQAPGKKVHDSGIPWNDASGRRLRQWLDMDEATFYDSQRVAIMPMGLCYPGKGCSGDLPPRTECAPLWHEPVLAQLPNIELTLLIGQYAQRYYLRDQHQTLTARIESLQAQITLPRQFPLPHPSPRNQLWFKRHPWFEQQLIPRLQQRIQELL